MDKHGCPLCGAENTAHFHEDNLRSYLRCPTCDLIFVPEELHLPPVEERSRYDFHENSTDDPEYRAFLRRLIDPLLSRIEKGSSGLDFGSGPGPTLSMMMRQRGFEMEDYDPFYTEDESVLERKYDFVACTETVEHFCEPRKSWEQMIGLVRFGGVIGVMTDIFEEDMDFSKWHYARDDTHVAFYLKETFEWIAGHYNLSANFYGRSVVILNKL
jgi:hypothetical protein